MEVCLNVAEPQMDIFHCFLGVGNCSEGISAGLPSIHAQGKYLLSAYYVPLHQQCKEEPNKERQGVGVLQEGNKKKTQGRSY